MRALAPGIDSALLAALLFGATTPAAKWLLSGVSPWLLAGLLYLGAGLGLAGLGLYRRQFGRMAQEASLKASDWPWLSGAIMAGGIVGPVLLMFGLTRTDAASASLLLNLEGVLTALLAWLVVKEHYDRRIVVGMIAIVAGGALLSWSGSPGSAGFLGPTCIAGACLAWAADNNLTNRVASRDPRQIATIKCLAAGVVNTALAGISPKVWPSPTLVAAAMALGFVGYGLSLVCFVRGLRHLGAARTGAYFALAPFIGALLALATGEPMTWKLAAAGGLMGLGLWLHLSERHAHEHSHTAMAHEHMHVHDEHHQHQHEPATSAAAPHSHWHVHTPLVHSHRHFPDQHHQHEHSD